MVKIMLKEHLFSFPRWILSRLDEKWSITSNSIILKRICLPRKKKNLFDMNTNQNLNYSLELGWFQFFLSISLLPNFYLLCSESTILVEMQ